MWGTQNWTTPLKLYSSFSLGATGLSHSLARVADQNERNDDRERRQVLSCLAVVGGQLEEGAAIGAAPLPQPTWRIAHSWSRRRYGLYLRRW
jgi:hypothetical protein